MSSGHVIVHGAMCQCKFGFTPDTLVVESQEKVYVNDGDGSQKLVANTMDIGQPFQSKTFGQCKLQPSNSGFLPCSPAITQWQNPYENVVLPNQGKVLTEQSKASCAIAGSPCIDFTWHGQTGQPNAGNTSQANQEVQSQLSPVTPVAEGKDLPKIKTWGVNEEGEQIQFFVEEITIEDLDEGSNNGNSNKKMGMIYGKEYRLKVIKYLNNKPPKDNKVINWAYMYINAEGTLIEKKLKQTGGIITFKTDDLDYCGNKITFYAYIENKDNEACLDVFHHYRFRWFDRKTVEEQIKERLEKPWKINQGGTSLCGMACLFYIFAKNDKQGYKELAETLHRTGKATHNGYTVEPDEDAKEEMYNTNPNTSKEHPWIPEIDWITMATTRSKESDFGYTGKKGQDASAINWPWLMTNLGKKFLGYTTVEMDYYKVNKSYIRDFLGSDEKIRILKDDIDKDYQNGYEICMMIDGDMMNNKSDYNLTDLGEYHWVSYEGGLELLNSEKKTESDYDEVKTIKFKCFTWGEPILSSRTSKGITKEAYRNNYYGYIKFK